MLAKTEDRRRRGRQRMRWLDGITNSMELVWVDSRSWWWTGRPGVLQFMGSERVGHDWATELNWTEVLWASWVKPILINWNQMTRVLVSHMGTEGQGSGRERAQLTSSPVRNPHVPECHYAGYALAWGGKCQFKVTAGCWAKPNGCQREIPWSSVAKLSTKL